MTLNKVIKDWESLNFVYFWHFNCLKIHVHLIYISIKSKMLYMLVEINRSEIRQNEKFRSKARSTSVQKY